MFIALTLDQNQLLLYVDNEVVAKTKVGKPDLTNNADGGAIYLAQYKKAGWDYIGVIDEVGIFNVALTEADVMEIMKNGLKAAALGATTAVYPSGKLTTAWGLIKDPIN